MTDLDLTTYKALSFDCYGTLIDWEAGIAAVLAPWAREQGLGLTEEELLLAYAGHEAAVEQETPGALYPDVLASAFRRTGDRLGHPVSDQWAQRLGRSVPDWPAFPDSAGALARLARHYRLIIVSNVHRDGFAGSNQHLHGDFAAVITAEDVGAYKPAPGHFRALDATLTELGLDRRDLLHVAQSLFHDPFPPGGKACRRCGSTGATTGPAGARPPSPRTSGPTTWSSPRWRTSPTPPTGPSPPPRTPRHEPARGAVATGSTPGIGLAIARRLSQDGFRVVVTGRDGERGETAAAELDATSFVPSTSPRPARRPGS
jgi:putative hydrolase of the HAD superfamily